MSNIQWLEEIADQKGKILLIEDFGFNFGRSTYGIETEIFDKPRLTEDSNGTQWECRGILRNVPVSTYKENLNERKYPKKLWERVEKEKLFEGGTCLADHSKDEGSVKSECGVWHNFRSLKEYAVADLYCIGEHGQRLLEKVKAGGKAGMSTVGFGSLLEDNKTVDWETFEPAENPCDHVRGPSQNVFAVFENLEENFKLKEQKEEFVSKPIEKEITNIKGEKIFNEKGNINNDLSGKEDLKMSEKLVEATLKNQIDSMLRKSRRSIKDRDEYLMLESQEALQDILGNIPEEFKEDRSKVENGIITLHTKLEEVQQEKTEKLKLTEQSNQSLQKELDEKKSKLEETEKQLESAKEILDKFGGNEALTNMKEDLNFYEEDTVERDSDIKHLKEDKENMQSDLNFYGKLVERCLKAINEDDEEIPEDLEEAAIKLQKDLVIMVENQVGRDEDIENLLKENRKLKEQFAGDGHISGMEADTNATGSQSTAAAPDHREYGDHRGNADYMFENRRERRNRFTERVNPAVRSYYEKELEKNPSIKDIEKEIKESSNVFEAIGKVKTFTEQNNDQVITTRNQRFQEAVSQDDWLGKRK